MNSESLIREVDRAVEEPKPNAGVPGVRDRRRVLIVTDDLVLGGMERQLALLAEALLPTSEVRVVSLSDGVYAGILREAGVEVSVMPRRFRVDAAPAVALGKIIRNWEPDIVHTFGWMSVAASAASCRLAKVPLVDASIQGGGVLSWRDRLTKAMTSLADVVITNSQAGLDAYGVAADRGRVVRNGFDPSRWALCQVREGRELPTTVVMTARMHKHKDYRRLLDAARTLGRDEPGGWSFLAVGSGDGRPSLMAEYQDLVESGVVAFPDAGTEVLGLVSEADIGVLLTNPQFAAEGVSNSIMEYMACGLPVVCTENGGNRELVIEGETGLIVPPSDAEAVVERLRVLRDDPAKARDMGRAGRERIATVFTVEALLSQTLSAYELATRRRRS